MRVTFASTALGRLVHIGVLAAGALALAGCATGYLFVQPDVTGGGSYYTGSGPYSGEYYGGYSGAGVYANPYGWYGPSYGSSVSLSLGFGNAWGWPYFGGLYGGFYGGWPYYTSLAYPFYGYGYGGYWRHRYRHAYYHGGRHDHDGYYRHDRKGHTRTAGRGSWNGDGHWHGQRFARGSDPAGDVRPPASGSFARGDFVRAPARLRTRRPVNPGMERPMAGRFAADGGRANERIMPMPSAVAVPREFRAQPAPAFRPEMPAMSTPRAMPREAFQAAPMRFSAPAAPRATGRSGNAPATRIR